MDESLSLTKVQSRALANKIKSAVISAADNIQQAGQWLIEFRDSNGWEALGYDSWTQCVNKEFTTTHGGRAHIFRLIQNVEVMENISENGDISFVSTSESTNGGRQRATESESKSVTFEMLPTRQTREIAKVAPERQKETFKKAVEIGNGHPTTASVKQAVSEAIKKAKPVKEVFRDETGYAIPDTALPLWNRRQEVKDVLKAISTARAALKAVMAKRKEGEEDMLFAAANINGAAGRLDDAWTTVSMALPYAVCPTCQGRAPDECLLCKGRAFISKHVYDCAISVELKSVRDKSCVKSS